MLTDLKRRFETRDELVGTWLSIGHAAVAEVNASLGFDFVVVDTEHTSMSLETVEDMSRAVDAARGDTSTIARVPWNDPVQLKRVLDTGVAGVMVPMIDSADDAEALVRAVRYPPAGIRGIAGGRAATYGLNFDEYVSNANESLLTIVQIETEAGLENVDEIAQVEGVDALFVGPADLSAALGVFGETESERFLQAISRILDAGERHDVPVGTLTVGTDDIELRVQQGFDYLIVGKDIAQLAAANRQAKSAYHDAVERHATNRD